MAGQLLVIAAVTALAILVTLYFFRSPSSTTQDAKVEAQLATDFPEAAPYIKKLALELPGRVLLPKDVSTFQKALNSYWSQQNRDIIPACIVQPSNTQELAIAVQHLAREHSARAKSTDNDGGLFAIRGGGANPANGISGVKDGVLLDLSLFNQVTPAEDGLSVTVGAGAYWAKVYKALEARGLGVAGGRTSPVGVGGSTLQGTSGFNRAQP
jgi:FAD/FMN-containing dehydrogenase